MKKTGIVLLWIIGAFAIGRAAVEPFVIDPGDPATYHLDWGGPHLAGVLAVHMVPGVIALTLMIPAVARSRRARSSRARSSPAGSSPAKSSPVRSSF